MNNIDIEYKLNIIRHYDSNAEIRSGQEWDWKTNEVNHFIQHLRERELSSLLDVGCGTGNEMLKFKEEGFNVTGIDLSPFHVQICRDRGLVVEVMDFYEMTFFDQTFDSVLAMSSLLHVPKKNLQIVIKEIHRCLKKDGLLFLGMFKGFYDGIMPSMDNKYIALYQAKELIELLQPYFAVIEQRDFRPSRLERYMTLVLSKVR